MLVDEKHTVATLYGMVNVPTGVWIDERGKIVRPNEVAFIDNRYSRQAGGTGLGLSLVRGLAELHGGRAWIESAKPKST